jgi:hypothetical protein
MLVGACRMMMVVVVSTSVMTVVTAMMLPTHPFGPPVVPPFTLHTVVSDGGRAIRQIVWLCVSRDSD